MSTGDIPIGFAARGKFVYAEAVVVTSMGAAAAQINFEKSTAGGTLLCSIGIAGTTAVGEKADGTMSGTDAQRTFDNDDINIEFSDGSWSVGAVYLTMWFEAATP